MKLIYEKKAKLVGSKKGNVLWLLNTQDDWVHDQYQDSYIYYGCIYGDRSPFHPISTCITGYFHDEEHNRWVKVVDGKVIIDPRGIDYSWENDLSNLVRMKLNTGRYVRMVTK